MAKSLRSKWRRKCRAVKRERYGKKELERLKKTVGVIDDTGHENNVIMGDMEKVITFTTADDINSKKTDEENMDVIGNMAVKEIKKKFNSANLRDKNGAYPIWLHPRKIPKKNKKAKKNKSKGKITKKSRK